MSLICDTNTTEVQVEPVGEAGALRGAKGFTTAVFESSKVPEGTKLYVVPQIAPDAAALIRELDVLLNGEEGAAKQASLCDLVAQLRAVVRKTGRPVLDASDNEKMVPVPAVKGEPYIYINPKVLDNLEGDHAALTWSVKRMGPWTQPLYISPQPAPDVARLVEALEAALKEIECIMQEAYNVIRRSNYANS